MEDFDLRDCERVCKLALVFWCLLLPVVIWLMN
jgi:hypothetical protein